MRPVVAVLGPTASGKSGLAMRLAREFNGVILNCDSRQIYCGMNIGTAKPAAAEMSLIEHRLYDLVDPDQSFSAGDYKDLAAAAIKEVWQQHKTAILTGGTGFYYAAIAEGLPPAGSDADIAAALQRELANEGLAALQSRLERLDPEAFSSIDINNPRRVMRALEIIMITGRPFSLNCPVPALPEAVFLPLVVTRPREHLHSRIEIRVKEMFDLGLKNEVESLFTRFGNTAPGLDSIGYAEWRDFFAGSRSEKDVFAKIVINSRQYAKRQETWFRKRPGVPLTDLEQPDSEIKIFEKVAEFLKDFPGKAD